MTVNGFRKYSLEIWRSSNHAQINLHDQMAPTRDVRECRSCHSTKMCWNWPSTAHHTEAQDSGSAKGGIPTCSSYQFPGLIKIYGWGGIFINTVFEDTFTRFRFGPKGDPYNESNWDHAPSTSSSYGHMPSVDTPPNVGPCLGLPRLSTSALAEYKCWIKKLRSRVNGVNNSTRADELASWFIPSAFRCRIIFLNHHIPLGSGIKVRAFWKLLFSNRVSKY